MNEKKTEIDMIAEFDKMLGEHAHASNDAVEKLLLLHRKVKQREQTSEEFSQYLKLRDQVVLSHLDTWKPSDEVLAKLVELQINTSSRKQHMTQNEVDTLLSFVTKKGE